MSQHEQSGHGTGHHPAHAGDPHEEHAHTGHAHGEQDGTDHHGSHASVRADHPQLEHAGHGEHAGHSSHGAHEHAGHGGHDHSHHVAMFRHLFWIALVLSIPVVAFSPMFGELLGYTPPGAPWTSWIPPVLGTIVYLWTGWPFLSGAVDELRGRRPGMMLLIGLATTVAFLSSWGATLGLLPPGLDFWWEEALLVVIMLLGHWLEMAALARTGSALDELAGLLPDTAERVTGPQQTEPVDPAQLVPGDVVLVRPGARVPADGEVVDGEANLDESMITGESRPVLRSPGHAVVAGTVTTDNAIRVRVTRVGEDTALAGIRRLVEQAQSSTTRAQLLADRAAGWLFWFALLAAIATASAWVLLGAPQDALSRTVTVLVIACPHALGLAIPLVVSIATGKAASAGILVSDRAALERAREIDTVVFDKTGTLTTGRPHLDAVLPVPGIGPDELLALAAAAESGSEHPLARAIVEAAHARGLDLPQATGFRSSPATGVQATIDGATVMVGGPRLLLDTGVPALPEAIEWNDQGATVLQLLRQSEPSGPIEALGTLALSDTVRASAKEAVSALQREGVRVAMITGDAHAVARAVGDELGITEIRAGARPEDKEQLLAAMKAHGEVVAMVGDGVNDAPALARADVGIAIGAGTDVAAATAGIVIANDDPRSVAAVIALSRATHRKMVQNLWWAAGYNVAAVPLAAGVLAPIGFELPMAVGALLMSASTVVVALNAQLLRRLRLTA